MRNDGTSCITGDKAWIAPEEGSINGRFCKRKRLMTSVKTGKHTKGQQSAQARTFA